MSKNVIQGVAVVVYPESCPFENLEQFIFPLYPCSLSPLHCWDKDKDNRPKKPHYHLLFQGKLSEKDKRYISKIICQKYFLPVYDIQAYYHYLYHWDFNSNDWCKGKAAYWKCDIKESETFDSSKLSEPYVDYFEMMLEYITHFTEFSDFVDSLPTIADEKFVKYLFSQYHFISLYCKSNHFKKPVDNN